ncbi:MAG: hypothetical protein A2V70_13050 [Planctomycetes bacterium RBG_13_63_9]|nr:MAG: hypothetical protein A2V70_13050 [Planctomycetes bacterium RBG_13_63_9]
MTGKEFMNLVAHGEADILQQLLEILAKTAAEYCVIGGLAVNAYAEPVVSLDLDIIVTTDKVEQVAIAAEAMGMKRERFEHSLNLTNQKSDLRLQLHTDPRYQDFIARSTPREILGYPLRVAAVTDVLQGKVWAYLDKSRRKSKRQKDLADIMRLVEANPALESELPPTIREQLNE